MIRKGLKYGFVALVLFVGYCFLPTKPNEKLVVKLEQVRKSYKAENFNKEYSILIDYNQPIFKKRLWVINNDSKEVVLNSFVSHAKKSGLVWFNKFSNVVGSKISSIGVFKTLGTYESNYGKGEYKLGMRIKGLEQGSNNNVLKRNIVFHPSYGLWSEGCFMTSPEVNKRIIDLTKNGSLLFVHYN